jgi:hypothetical protein
LTGYAEPIERSLPTGSSAMETAEHREPYERPEYLLADHAKPVDYQIPLPAEPTRRQPSLYIHAPRDRKGRSLDVATERFVDETRMSATS